MLGLEGQVLGLEGVAPPLPRPTPPCPARYVPRADRPHPASHRTARLAALTAMPQPPLSSLLSPPHRPARPLPFDYPNRAVAYACRNPWVTMAAE